MPDGIHQLLIMVLSLLLDLGMCSHNLDNLLLTKICLSKLLSFVIEILDDNISDVT